MTNMLVLIHTVSPLVAVFEHLARQMLPGVHVKHILDETLLERVRQRGDLAADDTDRLLGHALIAEQVGAKAVLVTCSTISPLVDSVRSRLQIPVIKIDEAMIERAVEAGRNIYVLATNPTTLAPTRSLLLAQGALSRREVQITEALVEGALSALLSGDSARHDQLLRKALLNVPPGTDVVVLAQASMARILNHLTDEERAAPIFSSPHLALEKLRGILAADEAE